MRFQTLNPSRAARSVALAAAIALTAPAALAHHVGDGSVALDQQVLAATNQLLAALSQWEALPPSLKESTLANLVQLAQSRQQALLALVKADPAVAATRLLPKPIRVRGGRMAVLGWSVALFGVLSVLTIVEQAGKLFG